jgi:hypothetical protein
MCVGERKEYMWPRFVEAILKQDMDEMSDEEENENFWVSINNPHHNWPKHAF